MNLFPDLVLTSVLSITAFSSVNAGPSCGNGGAMLMLRCEAAGSLQYLQRNRLSHEIDGVESQLKCIASQHY